MPPGDRCRRRGAPAYVPFFTWNGFYVGINAGYGFGQSQWTDTVTQASTGNFNVNGGLVGGTVGYNLQFGTVVFGLEGDIDWSNIKGSTTTNCIGHLRDHRTPGSARRAAGIGYAFDRFLPYFTGGAAFGDIKGSVVGGTAASARHQGRLDRRRGIEYAFIDNWSAKLEYLYVDLGKATCNAACSGGDPIDVTFTTNIVRAGVNYKF